MLVQDFVECGNGKVNVRLAKDEGRKKTQHGFAGAVDQDAALHHRSRDRLRGLRGAELERQHQTQAACAGDNGGMLRRQTGKLRAEIAAHVVNVGQHVFVLQCVNHGDGHGTCQRPASEGRAVQARLKPEEFDSLVRAIESQIEINILTACRH